MRHHAHDRTADAGHVYRGRFKSFPVQDDDLLLVLCRYVQRNALRANFVQASRGLAVGSLYRGNRSSE